MRHAHPAVKHARTLYIAGKLHPTRDPKPCGGQWHAGPLVAHARLTGMGTCGACGTLVHRSQVRRAS